jgi:hypothetical protein
MQDSANAELRAETRKLQNINAVSGDDIYGSDDPVVHWNAPDGSYGVCLRSQLVVAVLTKAEEDDLYDCEDDGHEIRDRILEIIKQRPYKKRTIQ